MEKIYFVRELKGYDSGYALKTVDEATTEARRKAYETGRDHHIMATIAIAKAPEQVNNVQVVSV